MLFKERHVGSYQALSLPLGYALYLIASFTLAARYMVVYMVGGCKERMQNFNIVRDVCAQLEPI